METGTCNPYLNDFHEAKKFFFFFKNLKKESMQKMKEKETYKFREYGEKNTNSFLLTSSLCRADSQKHQIELYYLLQ